MIVSGVSDITRGITPISLVTKNNLSVFGKQEVNSSFKKNPTSNTKMLFQLYYI